MRHLLPYVVVFAATLLPAQGTPPAPPTTPTNPAPANPAPANTGEELAAAKARLTQALQKTAGRTDTAFAAQWGLDGKQPDQNDGLAMFVANQAAYGSGKATGSWHADRLHVVFDGDQGDELVLAGRRMIARDANSEWKLRHERFADGNQVSFVPDAAALQQQLAAWELAVAHRTVGSLDDRPVEILTLTLTPEQVVEALWTGVLPPALAMGSQAAMFRMVAAGNAQRRAPPSPDATVDLVAWVDPATDVVHKLHFRMWSKNAGGGRQAVFVQGGGVARVQIGGVGVGGGGDDNADEDEAAKAGQPTDGSVRDENHLPVRSRKNMMVADYTVRFTDHGSKAAPQLSDAQKRLLGL